VSLLLDSHALLWALHAPEKIAPPALEAIRDRRTAVYFSAASVWELELKASSGKLELPDDWVSAAVDAGFVEIPVKATEARASVRLPWHHRDPFDRLLVAQALEHGLRIATRDALIAPYGVAVLDV
jgi:PIN domain nuclease of toxin-antitoxin system